MERFEMAKETSLELFTNFVTNAKSMLSSLSDNIKENIKNYEQSIEDTEKEIEDNISSREKCEHEITKMEDKIETIKETIDNVENTYKRIVDAYSTTSKGETKDIYSDVIDNAKQNCEKDVEKNRTEIARLNSDIEAIKNNISEFTRIVENLNKNLENYNLELEKYKRAVAYMEKTEEKISGDFDDMVELKPKSKSIPKVKAKEPKEEVKEEPVKEEPKKVDTLASILEPEIISINKEPDDTSWLDTKEEKSEPVVEEKTISKEQEDAEQIQRIFDLTGYKPKEEVKEEPVMEEPQPVYSGNLENLFADSKNEEREPVKEEQSSNIFDNSSMSEWEKMLNGGEDFLNTPEPPVMEEIRKEPAPVESVVRKTIDENISDTVNQLLKPYGTSYDQLKSLVGNEIKYKNGNVVPVVITIEDVIKAVNSIDSLDLKSMKTVGPEITLLRKVKHMKEGSR